MVATCAFQVYLLGIVALQKSRECLRYMRRFYQAEFYNMYQHQSKPANHTDYRSYTKLLSLLNQSYAISCHITPLFNGSLGRMQAYTHACTPTHKHSYRRFDVACHQNYEMFMHMQCIPSKFGFNFWFCITMQQVWQYCLITTCRTR